MALFKRTYRDPKTGKKCKTAKWYGQYRDPAGQLHRVPLATDKVAAAQMLADLIKKAERGEAGIVDPFKAHRGKTLIDFVEEYRQHLVAKENTHTVIVAAVNRLLRLFKGCGFTSYVKINAPAVENWLKEQRTTSGMGNATSNHNVIQSRAFCKWMVTTERAGANPLASLKLLNEAVDRRRERRCLSDAEFSRLLSAADAGDEHFGLSGPDRVRVYRVAALTGLRAKEIASLTAGSFDLAGAPATVMVEAAYSKHRRQDVLPLHQELVAMLRSRLEQFPRPKAIRIHGKVDNQASRLWPGNWFKHGSEIVRHDLARARAAWLKEADGAELRKREQLDFLTFQDQAGRVADFHSFRGRFVTTLGLSGVSLVVAAKLARHCDPKLTLKHYTHLTVSDLAADVSKIQTPAYTTVAATGTGG